MSTQSQFTFLQDGTGQSAHRGRDRTVSAQSHFTFLQDGTGQDSQRICMTGQDSQRTGDATRSVHRASPHSCRMGQDKTVSKTGGTVRPVHRDSPHSCSTGQDRAVSAQSQFTSCRTGQDRTGQSAHWGGSAESVL